MEPIDHPLDRIAAEKEADKPQPPDAPSFTCPKCGMTSYNTYDIEHMYCGNCHTWMRGWELLQIPPDPRLPRNDGPLATECPQPEELVPSAPVGDPFNEAGPTMFNPYGQTLLDEDVASPSLPERDTSADDKYIVFKKEAFFSMMGYLALPPWDDNSGNGMVGLELDCAVLSEKILSEVEKNRLKDAVVIRRQDKFASPALATYANMIGTVVALMPPGEQQQELLAISDYFEDQAQLAAEEAWKLPDR